MFIFANLLLMFFSEMYLKVIYCVCLCYLQICKFHGHETDPPRIFQRFQSGALPDWKLCFLRGQVDFENLRLRT